LSKTQGTKIEPKVILLIVAVVLLVGFAVYQGANSISGGGDQSFNTKIQAPPDSTRPPGFEQPAGEAPSEKQ